MTESRRDPRPSESELAARLPGALPRLRALACKLLGPGAGASDADDLVQEVAARALQYAERFDADRAIWPWLRRTAVRVAIDHRAGTARRPRALSEELLDGPDERGGQVGEAFARAEDVARLLAPLPAIERELLVHFHRDGRSVAEIAAERAMPEGTVKSHLHRARRRLAAQGKRND